MSADLLALISGLAAQREPGNATQPFTFASSGSTNTPAAQTGLWNNMFCAEEERHIPDVTCHRQTEISGHRRRRSRPQPCCCAELPAVPFPPGAISEWHESQVHLEQMAPSSRGTQALVRTPSAKRNSIWSLTLRIAKPLITRCKQP